MSAQPLYEYGGQGQVIHMALANGFPPATYTPLLHPLTAHYRVLSLPPRALWPDAGPAPTEPSSWREVTMDLLAGLHHYALEGVIAVGHSFGAVASMLAVIEQPQRFRGLVLLDPTFLPLPVLEMVQAAHTQGIMPRIPLIEQAQVRRDHFADASEAFTYWRAKSLFKDWTDDALWVYTHAMLRPADEGAGLQLTWPRDWEAYYYMSIITEVWDELPKLRGLLPTLILAGETSDTYLPASAAQVREILPDATHVTLPGGHLFPHTAPDAARALIEDWLREQKL